MDGLGAFCSHAPLGSLSLGGGPGPLSGLRAGIKDLFDIEGFVTGAGNPTWFASASPATATAPAVVRLIDAGARVVGKTITDELAFSLNGENAHYGTPQNPAALGCIPGGSSAGSASAVAGGLVDIGLGTDTGGSVRLPSSYCGLWGMRPSHGAVPIEGCVPLAPLFDTVGWFARDPALLASTGAVLLAQTVPAAAGFSRVVIATDAFERVPDAFRGALRDAAYAAAARVGPVETITLAPEGLDQWRAAFRTVQSYDVWQTHGAWVTEARPVFGPGIDDRFAFAASLTADQFAEARAVQASVRDRLDALLTPETLLIVPGGSAPPPKCGTGGPMLEDFRNRALEVLCPAGLGGLPQLAMPALRTADGPLGLGLVAARGGDARLLALATGTGTTP